MLEKIIIALVKDLFSLNEVGEKSILSTFLLYITLTPIEMTDDIIAYRAKAIMLRVKYAIKKCPAKSNKVITMDSVFIKIKRFL